MSFQSSLLNTTIQETLALVEAHPEVAEATQNDKIYCMFDHPSYLSPADADEGMWFEANQKLDALFGRDTEPGNIRKGPYGLQRVIKWLEKARQHDTWDSPTDKLDKARKGSTWLSSSDRLLKLKMENIADKLKRKCLCFH